MFLISTEAKVKSGKTNLIAISNIAYGETSLLLRKVEITSPTPLIARGFFSKIRDITDGEDISDLIVNSRPTHSVPPHGEVSINLSVQEEGLELVKSSYMKEKEFVGEADGIQLDVQGAFIVQVESQNGGRVLVNLIFDFI